MAQIVYLKGLPLFDPDDNLFDAVRGITPTATTTAITYVNTDNGDAVVFHGTFTLDGGGNVAGGTVTSFDVSAGATPVMTGTGYSFSATALVAAIVALLPFNPDPFNQLIYANVKLIGTDHDDESLSAFSGVLLGHGGDDFLFQLDSSGGTTGFIVMKGGKGDDDVNGGDNPTGSDLYGGLGNDEIGGGQTSSTQHGGKGDDTLFASFQASSTSALYGGDGNDVLWDNNGTAIMRGGKGDDAFLFRTLHADFILGFNVQRDVIGLDPFRFGDVTAGIVTAAEFLRGTAATTAEQRILYDPNTGNTFYDEDGTGGTAPVLFAVLPDHLKVHAHNFVGLV